MANNIQNRANPVQQTVIPDKEKQPTKKGTGFVNLQKYLGANQGNQLGGAVAGNIQQAGTEAQNALKGAQQQFGTGLQQARSGIAQQQDQVQGVLGRFDKPEEFQGPSDQEITSFKDLREKGYSGPTGFENPEQLQQKASQAAGLGQLAGSREGRQELLRGAVQAPAYTATQQRLDELLMSLGGGAGQVKQAGKAIAQTPADIQRQIAAAQSEGTTTQKSYQGLQQQAAGGVQSREDSLQQLLSSRVSDLTKDQQNLYNQAKTQLATGSISQDLANKIGLSLAGGAKSSNFYTGIDPTQYLRQGNRPDINAVTSQNEASRLSALSKLAGNPQGYFNPDQSLVGTYDPNKAVTYRSEDLQGQIAANQARYNDLIRTPVSVLGQPGTKGYEGVFDPFKQGIGGQISGAAHPWDQVALAREAGVNADANTIEGRIAIGEGALQAYKNSYRPEHWTPQVEAQIKSMLGYGQLDPYRKALENIRDTTGYNKQFKIT